MRPPVLILALLLAATPVAAAEVDTRVRVAADFDTNSNELSNRLEDESGYGGTIAPSVRLSSERERLRYDLSYRPSFLYLAQAEPPDRVNHRADGSFSYLLGRRTTLVGAIDYSNRQDLDRVLDSGASGTDLVFERDRRQRAEGSFTLSRRWSSRLSSSAGISQSLFLTTSEDRSDAFGTRVFGSMNYRVSEANSLGLNASFRQQSFDATESEIRGDDSDESSRREGSSTRFFSLRGTWAYEFDDRTTLTLSAGPLLVDPEERDPFRSVEQAVAVFPTAVEDNDVFLFDATSCPRSSSGERLLIPADCELLKQELPPLDAAAFRGAVRLPGFQPFATAFAGPDQFQQDAGEERLTLSLSASLSREWRNVAASISFSRSEGGLTGLGTSRVTDTVSTSIVWTPARDWRVRLLGRFTRDESTRGVERTVPIVEPGVTLSTGEFLANAARQLFDAETGIGKLAVIEDTSAADAKTFLARLVTSHKLNKRWSFDASVSYRRQKAGSEFFAARRKFENVNVSVGVTYRFPKFRL